jgi:hypothetical protein
MPSKTYLNYKPLIEKVEVGEKPIKVWSTKDLKDMPTTKFVTDHSFKLQFGWDEYPKINLSRVPQHTTTYNHPKNQGSNGKNSRFR